MKTMMNTKTTRRCRLACAAAVLTAALCLTMGLSAGAQTPAAEPQASVAKVYLQPETPELAAQDPMAAPTAVAENSEQETTQEQVVLTPEQIHAALDAGTLDDVQAQCLELGEENGILLRIWEWLFKPYLSGWRTFMGKTYYYSPETNERVTGIQSFDGKLYYFDPEGVLQENVVFGIDVSKYQSGLDWDEIKAAGVEFAIIRIGYRGYGSSGVLVMDPKFEEHFTGAQNAGLKVGVYFFTQATTVEEAQEEALACITALNGRSLDYPVYFDTEASSSPTGTGRADALGVTERTDCAIAFCEEIEANGYRAGVYASTLWFRNRVELDRLTGYSIWNANYGVAESPVECDIWQGSCTVRLNGYNGDLDANISYVG